MALPIALVAPIVGVVDKVLDRVLPDPKAREAAALAVRELEQRGEFENTTAQLSAILAEANSQDKWTSRARPMFLYVMYSAIALCFVGAVVGVWFPAHVAQAAANLQVMLAAIPESLWALFGVGYLGYTGARSWDKSKGASR